MRFSQRISDYAKSDVFYASDSIINSKEFVIDPNPIYDNSPKKAHSGGINTYNQSMYFFYDDLIMWYGGGLSSAYLTNMRSWNPATQVITTFGSTGPTRQFSAGGVYQDKFYTFCSFDDTTVWEYDFLNDIWTQLTSFPGTSREHWFGTFNESKFYLFGGNVSTTTYNDLWEYDVTTDAWTQLTSGSTPRSDFAITSYNNKLYIIGGWWQDLVNWWLPVTYYNDLWEYDITTDTWAQLTSVPIAAERWSAIAYSDKIFLWGGTNDTDSYYKLWIYDINDDTWTLRGDYPQMCDTNSASSLYPGMIIFNKELYIIPEYGTNSPGNSVWKFPYINKYFYRKIKLKNVIEGA